MIPSPEISSPQPPDATSRLAPAPDGPAPPLFVYGTLMDPSVLAAVLGRAATSQPPVGAAIKGWRVVCLPGRPYPGLVRDAGAEAPGQVIFGLGRRDLDSLTAYEGGEYRLAYLTAVLAAAGEGPRNVASAVYLPVDPIGADAPAWSFADWQLNHRAQLIAELGRRPVSP